VEDALLEQLYLILLNQPRPSKLAQPTPPPAPPAQLQISNIQTTRLALETLGAFDFQRHALQMFMRYIAQGYLVADSVEVWPIFLAAHQTYKRQHTIALAFRFDWQL